MTTTTGRTAPASQTRSLSTAPSTAPAPSSSPAPSAPVPAPSTAPAASSAAGPDLEALASRVDAALAAVDALPAAVRAVATELKDALDALHRAGLARIVVDLKADPRGRELLFDLVDAPEVLTLLQLHGLVRPPDLATRTRLAFDALVAQGLQGEVVSVEGSTAVVRLPDATGCSAAEVKDGVVRSLLARVPGLTAVEVEPPARVPTLVPLTSLTVRGGAGWVDGPALTSLVPGRPVRAEVAGTTAVVLLAAGRAVAWGNACPRQGEPLDGGQVDVEDDTLTCPGHGLVFDASTGECRSDPGVRLTRVPTREHAGLVQLRPPRSAS